MFSLQNVNLWSIVSLLVSSGAIGYVVRLVIRIEVLEHFVNEKKEEIDELSDRLSITESDVLRIRDSITNINATLEKILKTCDTLPQINERLGTILDRTGTFVPREQLAEKFDRLNDKIEENTRKISGLDTKFTNVYQH